MHVVGRARNCRNWVVVLLAAGATAAWAAIPVPPRARGVLTQNCDSCTFAIVAGSAPYHVGLGVRRVSSGGRIAESLRVFRTDRAGTVQVLPVHGATAISDADEFYVGVSDIDFDGCNDLFFATSRGAANTSGDYWLFRPADQKFIYLGVGPKFKVDQTRRLLVAFERGGDAGMVYRKDCYRVVDGALIQLSSEQQEATGREGVYRKRYYRRAGGRLRLVKTETVNSSDWK